MSSTNGKAKPGGLIIVDRWGIEQPPGPKADPRSRQIAIAPESDEGEARRKRIRAAHAPGPVDIHAKYDLASTTADNQKHWAQADSYDADSANNRWVRNTMVRRARYEAGNNAYIDGIQSTHATFVVRKGPRLRIVSEEEITEDSPEAKRNEQIKRDWRSWCKRVKFRRKLWTMAHAKIQDGEPMAVVRYNPKIDHDVKLDICLIETEQCQTPLLPQGVVGYIDGIRFDPWGNTVYYDILPRHPGAMGLSWPMAPDHIPARYVLHWFMCKRPNQHRGIPEMASTLGLGAVARRWREACAAGAETIADISLIAKTQGAPEDDGPDQFSPFSAVEFQKRMMMLLPMGWDVFQPKGESPPANYEMFVHANIAEMARPKSMPYNLAASDSSKHSFASGKLDTIPYYIVIDDLEREDCNDLVMTPLFALWWQEYVLVHQQQFEMLDEDPLRPPEHEWDWPRNPVADAASEATTNAERLRTGQASPDDIAHEDGDSWEERLKRMARAYGKTVSEVREAVFTVTFAPKSGGQLQPGAGPVGEDKAAGDPPTPGKDPVDVQLAKLAAMVAELAVGFQSILAFAVDQKRGPDGKFAKEGGVATTKLSDSFRHSVTKTTPRKLASVARGKAVAINEGANGCYKVKLKDGKEGIWKPASEEMPHLREGIPAGSYCHREQAASRVADVVGLGDLVPKTEVIEHKGKIGSLQEFVGDAQIAMELPLSQAYDGKEDRARAAAFDFVMGNTDRHEGNWLIAGGKLKLIDNGLSLPEHVVPRDYEYAADLGLLGHAGTKFGFFSRGEKIPATVKESWDGKWGEIESALKSSEISDAAIGLAKERYDVLMSPKTKTFGHVRKSMQGDAERHFDSWLGKVGSDASWGSYGGSSSLPNSSTVNSEPRRKA